MTKARASLLSLLLCLAGAGVARGQSLEGVELPAYDTKYYVIHTDLTGDALREAQLRMTRMAEEYRARTRGFFGSADRKLPFYLFKKAKDYYATGAPEESAGVFTGTSLLALAGEKTDLQTWHTIQHEGFHQYVYSVIGSNMPIWLNEGMAEYFGEGLFTGDGFVSGLIPPWRLERVQKTLKAGEFVSLRAMMNLPADEWNSKLSLNNYDQAWAMVQFLAHGDGGRYQRPFVAFISDIGRGKQWQVAWRDHFGGDVEGFEARWKAYWAGLPEDPTAGLYGQVGVQTLTSFLGRAYAQRQRFESYAEFAKALVEGKVQVAQADWLPPSLGKEGVLLAKTLGAWAIEPGERGRPPRVALTMADGTRVVGSFAIGSSGKVERVVANVEAPRKAVGAVRGSGGGGRLAGTRPSR